MKYFFYITLFSILFFHSAPLQNRSLLYEEFKASFQDICWSPDGNAIYFSGMKCKTDYSDYVPEKWRIFKYYFAAKNSRLLVDSALYVCVSPLGKEIAVGKIIDGNRDIYVYDSSGKNPKCIVSHIAEEFGASFSPDGQQIVFNSKRGGNPEIYIMNIQTIDLKQITFSEGFKSYNPSWSPDGKHIVYFFEKGDHKDQIHIINADGTADENITNDTLNNYFPGWVNKNEIIYTQNDRAFTIKSDGTDKKQLLNIKSFYTRISPDGSKIAFINANEECIEVITFEGEPVTKIFLTD